MTTNRHTSASGSATVTMTDGDLEHQTTEFIEKELVKNVRNAVDDLPESRVEWVLRWIRSQLKDFLVMHIKDLPVVGQWAARIGATAAEFIFTVITTLIKFMKVAISAPHMWKKAHESAMRAWNANESNGLLTQTYAYGKKMAAFVLEVVRQCFERALAARGLALEAADKDEISKMLDGLLPAD